MKSMFVFKMFVMIVIAFSLIYAVEEEECEKGQRLVITGIIPGGAAENVGMKQGDGIISYNGTEVHCLKKLNALKQAVKTDSVEIMIKRNGEIISYKIPKGMIGIYAKDILPDIEFEKDAVVIEKIGRLDWDTGETSSFIAALTRIAEYLNIERDYTYLMGASGSAFRILFHEDWCPSSPDATVGFDCGAIAVKSINLKLASSFFDKEGKNKQEIQQKIIESIDKKMPVVAIDLIEIPEWGLIVGHQKDGEELIVRTYFDKREGYDIAEKFPWSVITISQGKGEIDDNKNFKNSLKVAQKLYGTEKYEKYYSGIAAIEYWIKRLKEDDIASLDEEKFENVMLANAWIFGRLADDRMFGAKYLRTFAPQFPDLKDEIIKLASLYEEENEMMTETEMIAPYPFQIKKREDWTKEMRAKEIEILTNVLGKEQEAYLLIKEINKKLEG